jgi:hypothetical protein
MRTQGTTNKHAMASGTKNTPKAKSTGKKAYGSSSEVKPQSAKSAENKGKTVNLKA